MPMAKVVGGHSPSGVAAKGGWCPWQGLLMASLPPVRQPRVVGDHGKGCWCPWQGVGGQPLPSEAARVRIMMTMMMMIIMAGLTQKTMTRGEARFHGQKFQQLCIPRQGEKL